jgi:hypothetical protein
MYRRSLNRFGWQFSLKRVRKYRFSETRIEYGFEMPILFSRVFSRLSLYISLSFSLYQKVGRSEVFNYLLSDRFPTNFNGFSVESQSPKSVSFRRLKRAVGLFHR